MKAAAQAGQAAVRPVREIWQFLAWVCLFSLAANALRLHVDHANTMLDRFSMWGPAFAAAMTCWICRIDLRTLGWRWPARRWLAFAYLLPLLYAAPVYLLTWLAMPPSFGLDVFATSTAASFNLVAWKGAATFAVGLPLLLTVGIISGLTWALGEEIGWRGFLFPRLMERLGFSGACVASGAIWAIWHYPGMIWGQYNAGTHPVFALSCFTVMVVAMSFVMGWLRCRVPSVWPCALMHASHNLFVQAVFDPMTVDTGLARYATTEFGLGLCISVMLAAWLVCTGRFVPSGLSHRVPA